MLYVYRIKGKTVTRFFFFVADRIIVLDHTSLMLFEPLKVMQASVWMEWEKGIQLYSHNLSPFH